MGGAVSLSIDVWDEPAATARLRLWVDEQGELLLDMDGEEVGDHLRFTRTFEPSTPEVIWYSFNITAADGAVWRYGAAREYGCGEGAFAYGEPPSFQITVFERLRPELPEWYKGGIAYQIFPDRFARGKGWEERVAASLGTPRRGPERRLVEDWGTYPRYDRTPDGRIAVWDFYGGTLDGVREKLPYLESMGITVIYFNPIFEAASSHRYDTANYLRIDPMLGDEETFSRLCAEAGSRGISIILDGVFNHVGADSLYFNKYGNYPDGAFVSEHSRYRDWFTFNDDGSYESWWGIDDLPDVNEDSAEFRELMPDNAVSYFVSYYDYYQPEAYIASTDTYIEKDAPGCPRLAPGRRRRADRRVHSRHQGGGPGREARCPAHRRGVGGRDPQGRLWSPAPLLSGARARRHHELPPAPCAQGLPHQPYGRWRIPWSRSTRTTRTTRPTAPSTCWGATTGSACSRSWGMPRRPRASMTTGATASTWTRTTAGWP